MKKILVFGIILLVMTAISGCNTTEVLRDTVDNQQHAKDVSRKIVQYINDENVNGIKALFSNYAQNSDELEDDIENFIDCIDGEIISFEIDYNGETGAIDDGKWTIQDAETEIEKIVTDTKKEYIVIYQEYLVYAEDESKEGLYFLQLRNGENKVLFTLLYSE